MLLKHLFISILLVKLFYKSGLAILCYQCDSNEDGEGACPAGKYFDTNVNALIDCNSFEADIPGVFCVKIFQRSPGWGGWLKETRRCGTRSDTSVTWGCRYWYDDNGVYKEACYCNNDGCNHSQTIKFSAQILTVLLFVSLFILNIRR